MILLAITLKQCKDSYIFTHLNIWIRKILEYSEGKIFLLVAHVLTWYSRSQGSESCNPIALFDTCKVCMHFARGCM